MAKPTFRPWLCELRELRKNAGYSSIEEFVITSVISVGTYRQAETDFVASHQTLQKIDRLFELARKHASAEEQRAIETWLELRRKNLNPGVQTDSSMRRDEDLVEVQSQGVPEVITDAIESSASRQRASQRSRKPLAIAFLAVVFFVLSASVGWFTAAGMGFKQKPPLQKQTSMMDTPPYGAQFLSSSNFSSVGNPIVECNGGDLITCSVVVKNVGRMPWRRRYRPISLGVVHGIPPSDRDRIGHGPVTVAWYQGEPYPWSNEQNRVYLGYSETVQPGQVREFVFKLKVPVEPGPYPVTLQMVMDGKGIAAPPSNDGWFAGETVHATFLVRDPPPK